jgi:hypothetical protein
MAAEVLNARRPPSINCMGILSFGEWEKSPESSGEKVGFKNGGETVY